jgi:hypothetical protein
MTLGIFHDHFRLTGTLRPLLVLLALLTSFTSAGCIHHPKVVSSALPMTEREARELTRDLQLGRPATLQRPVVILGGFRSPGLKEAHLSRWLREYTSDDGRDFMVVSFTTRVDFDRMVDKAIRSIERRWPSDDPDWTTEVDVVGLSMGGLVGRYAAMEPMADDARISGKRLNINRLFTIATPHRGAAMADAVAPGKLARAMRTDSDFLNYLDSGLADVGYSLVPYARLQDDTIGYPDRAAPHGMDPIWVDGPWIGSHFGASRDERILLDIALRLRGEPPVGSPAPPPDPSQFQPKTAEAGFFVDEDHPKRMTSRPGF